MADFGVIDEGFVVKPFDVILAESISRAQTAFGSNVDLTPTSPLRKILEVTAAEDAELWKRMEDLYYGNFLSTAEGDDLNLLGEDVGVPRRQVFATGTVNIKINNPAPGRQYVVPEGTVVVTGTTPVQAFHTQTAVTLSSTNPQADVAATAFTRGPAGNIAANQITAIDPGYSLVYLANLGPATLTVKNDRPFTGGLDQEPDDAYRGRLLGYPRTIWTLDSVQQAVLDVDGVIDVRLNDRLGGVDVSQSLFNLFAFNERLFSEDRRIGAAYFFDVVVAHEVAWPWHTQGAVTGIYEMVAQAVDRVRPVGIYANIIEANHIEVGVSAKVIVERGSDQGALLAAVKDRLANDIGQLKLGDDVLFSQVVRAFVEQAGVVDVQNVRLRRCPAAFGRITFGPVPFQSGALEMAVGENLVLDPSEIAVFRLDSELIDLAQVEER
jgi:hypothetical protein